MGPTDWLDDSLRELRSAGLLRKLSERNGPQGPSIELDEQPLLNFGSNDYLGLANEIRDLTYVATQTLGWGSGASPLITGRSSLHAELEQRLADFEGQPAALLFGSGYAANVGTITSMVGRGDTIFSDAKNHASIIDGCRLSRARIEIFRHTDIDHLRELLVADGPSRRRLIVTDSLFSMDGDLAPLDRYAELAEEYGCMFVVDEAHATGVLGEHGRGVCEHLSVESAVTARVGTMSKALGSIGGFVTGSEPLIQWIANTARPYFFSTASPPAVCAAGEHALRLVKDEPERRRDLLKASTWLREQLSEQGWQTGNSESQIIPIYLGTPAAAMSASAKLREQGLFVPGIRPPTVPAGESMLRISLSYRHTRAQLMQLLEALKRGLVQFSG